MFRTRMKESSSELPCRGFTLVEVILAASLFAVAAGILAQSIMNLQTARLKFSESPDGENIRRQVRLHLLQMNQRDRLESGGNFRSVSGERVAWETQIQSTKVVDVFEIKIEMRLQQAGNEANDVMPMRLHVLRPSWSDPAERSALINQKRQRIQEARPVRR